MKAVIGAGSDTKTIRKLIAEHAVFKGLAPQYLDLLAEVAMFKEFEPNELIFREGDPANRFYLILDGEVALENSGENGTVRIQLIGADDVLGWSWLFPPYFWHFDARSTKRTQAIFFYGTWLRENCERDHDFGYEMMKRMVPVIIQRMQAARRQIVNGRKTE